MGDISDYATAAEAAVMLGLTRSRVNQLCRDERIPSVIVGKSRLILRADVEAFKRAPRLKRGPKAKAPKKGKK